MIVYTFGSLLQMYVLDDRQYRSPQPAHGLAWGAERWCSPRACPDLRDSGRTLLGAEQEAWLLEALGTSSARWNGAGATDLMASTTGNPAPDQAFWTDGWDGYPRAVSFAELHPRSIAPRIAGHWRDVHSYWVCDLKPISMTLSRPWSPREFCGTSITSQGRPQEHVMPRAPTIRTSSCAQ